MLFGGDSAQSYYEEGLTSAIKGNYEEAIRYFKEALKRDKYLYQAEHQIGRCLLRQGKTKEALPILEKAVKHLDELSAPKIDLGNALIQQGQIKGARDIFSYLLKTKPQEKRAVLGLAYCAFHEAQWETAAGLLQRTLELGRSQFDVHFLLAQAADKMGEFQLAIAQYQQAENLMQQSIEATPDQAAAYYLLARVHEGMGYYNRAVEDIDQALLYAEEGQCYSAYNILFSRETMLAYKETLTTKLRK
ncbi:MAG: tetratricopeptide repeat protein [Candidatus Hydrogenedentales bacterium]|jgi:tetratricopeptide (TPR) repeat protein